MTGITFLMQRIAEGEVDDLSPEHVTLVGKARNEITTAFALAGETVVMMFRIGHSPSPSARSLRLPQDKMVHLA